VIERGRREYAEALRPHYQRADRRARGRLLDEYCRATGCHRKTAIRVLRRAPGPGRRAPLLAVDVATTWTDLDIIWGVGQARVGTGVHHLRQRWPVPLRAWHSDNGREFLNEHLVAWCRREGVHLTRGRPYRKNDQAWVEQRNGLVVRRLVDYDRYSSRAAFTVFPRLYRLLPLQLNFFRPVRKLLSKRRRGARVVKRYDTAHTPYQRLLAAGALPPAQRQALAAQLQTLDPIALAREIEQPLDLLWKLADTRRTSAEVARG